MIPEKKLTGCFCPFFDRKNKFLQKNINVFILFNTQRFENAKKTKIHQKGATATLNVKAGVNAFRFFINLGHRCFDEIFY